MLVNTATLGVMVAISGVMAPSSLTDNVTRMGANRSEIVFEAIASGLAGDDASSLVWRIAFYTALFLLSKLLHWARYKCTGALSV